MALPIQSFSIVEVTKPNVGERSPACVRADVSVTLNVRQPIRSEWEALRKHDVCFLLTVRPQATIGTRYDPRVPFGEQISVAYVRGCEIEGMLGADGKVIEEWVTDETKKSAPLSGDQRTWRVWLDQNQYRLDMERIVKVNATSDVNEDVYAANTPASFNVLLRRRPEENNFKAVLDTIRQMMNTRCVVPDWLHDIILGYGDPNAAHYSNMPNALATLDFNDTFLNVEHLRASFPACTLKAAEGNELDAMKPPFRLTFRDVESRKRKADEAKEQADTTREIVVDSVLAPNRGPYAHAQPRRNAVPFTPSQVEAIKSGMQPGLTMVVGPPGSGKTDVAVQIIANIYHNWPDQRTLIVTHSNTALNQLFEKIIALDIDERHLLRLGHGEEALETEKDFSRYGRVNFVLAKRLELLKEVERLQTSLGVTGDVAYTCETAAHFFLYQVLARWEIFASSLKRLSKLRRDPADIAMNFPFAQFFADAAQPLFKGVSYDDDWTVAEGCWRYIRDIFQQIDEFRAFELLRSGRDRAEYLLVKEAKIIAMTCTHAALRRSELVQLSFKFDNVLMEEAAQILEIETFIPLLVQNPDLEHNRLKRWIMIGDHHQLPPVIKNMALQKYANMEQSLFARFVRLGVPTVDLDAQGRARSSIASLYNWRYRKLNDLPHILRDNEYQVANAGLVYDYQLINVDDFNGVGESAPTPFFYQNLAEAEYAVALFMYMRLLGYPAAKITLLTTYNGQRHLLQDIVEQRCATNALIGRPHKITTVDKYQGQQNDYIILSLVRTQTVGHLRDVRRLVVAMSRARLGLYVFARVELFRNCFELTPAFNILCQRPMKLLLVPNEEYPTQRKLYSPAEPLPTESIEMAGMAEMAQFVYDFYSRRVDVLREQHAKDAAAAKAAMAEQLPYGSDVDGHVTEALLVQREADADADERRTVVTATEKDIEFEVFDEGDSGTK